jgi:hypothetical protein
MNGRDATTSRGALHSLTASARERKMPGWWPEDHDAGSAFDDWRLGRETWYGFVSQSQYQAGATGC